MLKRALTTCLFIAITTPSTVWAHPLVERGRRLYEAADFSGALVVLDEAQEASTLERDDVLELLELRALIGLAIDDGQLRQRALEDLKMLEPSHVFGPEAPPAIVERFQALDVTPLRLGTRARRNGDFLTIDARLRGSGAQRLVRHIVIHGRAQGGAWQIATDGPLDVEGNEVEWYVEVIGLGGAVLLRRAGGEEPRDGPDVFAETGENHHRRPWIWGIVAGAATVVAAIVVVSVAVANDDDEIRTTVNGPIVIVDE